MVICLLLIPVLLGEIPDRFKLWAPLHIKDKPNLLTEYKLSALKSDAKSCYLALGKGGIKYTPVPDEETSKDFCEKENRVTLNQSLYPYSSAVTSNCALTVALAIWEEHVLKPAAQDLLNTGIAKISHYGIYSCRRVNNSSSGRPSQHASANAIDISGFTMADGSTVSIVRDWGKDTPKADFLKSVHRKSCSVFKGVLGPNYNAAHRDHFHLDLGPYNICR